MIRRLPRYYRFLGELLDEGVERISSGELSERMNVTASQIRQDLNNFGGFGHQGYGYHVDQLYHEIGRILGIDRVHRVILIGAGHLGQAIANYEDFPRLGFQITGLFDVDRDVVGTSVKGIPVMDIGELPAFAKEHEIDIAALTLPKEAAKSVAKLLYDIGIRSIWNFAHVDLEMENTVVENVHLSDSLMQLSYQMQRHHQKGME